MSAYDLVFPSYGVEQFQEETIFQIEHHLPFKPKFTCYFYVYDSPSVWNIGAYNLNYFRMGVGGEWLRAVSDSKYFKIVHSVSSLGPTGAGITYPYTMHITNGSVMTLRMKYMIHPVPDIGTLIYYGL